MKYLLTLILSFGCLQAFAGGGIWVLEIRYELSGEPYHGFVLADYWAEDYDRFIGPETGFTAEFLNAFKAYDSLPVYDQIIDREAMAQVAIFPIHPFELVRESEHRIKPSDLQKVELIKVWRKSDYMVNVLTDIAMSDTSWIGGTSEVEYPIGDEVGCRLEVYNFSGSKMATSLIAEYASLYQMDPVNTTSETATQKTELLQKLKQQHVVVVELCGC